MSGRGNRIRPPRLIANVVTRCGTSDPGFIRLRRGLQTVGATAATWATVSAAASLGTVVSVALTVYLVQVALWAAAAFLAVEIFLSFALRAWSVRAGSLAAGGALTTFVASGGHFSVDRPADAARRSILVLDGLGADVAAAAAFATNPAYAASAPNTLHTSLDRVIACRRAVDEQLSALIPHVDGNVPIDELRVTLHSTSWPKPRESPPTRPHSTRSRTRFDSSVPTSTNRRSERRRVPDDCGCRRRRIDGPASTDRRPARGLGGARPCLTNVHCLSERLRSCRPASNNEAPVAPYAKCP